jgi:hypothetical protein
MELATVWGVERQHRIAEGEHLSSYVMERQLQGRGQRGDRENGGAAS